MFVRTESLSQFIRFYPVVSLLILIHAVVFIATSIPGGIGNSVLFTLAGINGLVSEGEYWRLVTPIFAHADLWHVLFNTFSLVLFAPALERLLGSFQFAVVYLLAGVIANVATWVLQPPFYTSVGASGSIFGLFGLYAAIWLIYKQAAPLEIRQVMVPVIVISVVMTFFGSNINITAHIAGLAAGIFIGLFIFQQRRRE
ncbi:rhomboid family intramembrane serine protease [Jeotgalibacillus haloalkalitolerans]|uniref:Rhomboid family intramembrane serine protease n=1 Tax=Jeotgalibacillus haloalkalitolerans TaxID=3104292 RepID=A0ABU5KQC1_9BACL|nr:rhomboid family intramembrane serine protease [Jeotgalibacillus sp. HH7-29]MDZ5713156.1 rhomboid family intramembrane serine protease [Jeotgalibacillus sp. HH7-29]